MTRDRKTRPDELPWQDTIEEMKGRLVAGCDSGSEKPEGGSDLERKLQQVRAEFIGLPELCFYHADLIVHIRRGIDLRNNLHSFDMLWEREHQFLSEHLNSRWLLSAADTFADYGKTGQREAALTVSSVINTIRFAETERVLASRDKTEDRLDPEDNKKLILWDGIESYNITEGDAIYNYIKRLIRTIRPYREIYAIFSTLLTRSNQSETVLSRLMMLNENYRLPKF